MTALEASVRRMAERLDVASLEALANRGLVRRAMKDVERGLKAEVLGVEQGELRVRVGAFEVYISAVGPAAARCSCPSPGICQHIVSALVLLGDLTGAIGPRSADTPTARTSGTRRTGGAPTGVDLTPVQIESWAGKAAFRSGVQRAFEVESTVDESEITCVRFPAFNVEVRFVGEGILDGVIASCPRRERAGWVVAAVVCLQRRSGVNWQAPDSAPTLGEPDGAPRSRSEVRVACCDLLSGTIRHGLAKLSRENEQRWRTLAVSALGVQLPKMALLIRGIGDDVGLMVTRNASADSGRLLGKMSETYALCHSLQRAGENPSAELVGVHRTRYEEVGNLDLAGIAAWPWRTASGYEGVTVLFWESGSGQWNCWTASRPRGQEYRFSPVGAFRQPGPWEGAASPEQLSRSQFRLMHARRNSNGRLSGSGRSRALVTGPVGTLPEDLPIIRDWSELAAAVKGVGSMGLRESNPLRRIVAIQPAEIRDGHFDPAQQAFSCVFKDGQGRRLVLELRYDDLTDPAIKWLEAHLPEGLPKAVFIGHLSMAGETWIFQPFTLHPLKGKAIHLLMHQEVKTTRCSEVVHAGAGESILDGDLDEDPSGVLEVGLGSRALRDLLEHLEDLLQEMAESGLGRWSPPLTLGLEKIAGELTSVGGCTLAFSVRRLVHEQTAVNLMSCVHLTRLFKRAAAFVS